MKLLQLTALAAALTLCSCSTSSVGNNDTSDSIRSQSGGVPHAPSRSSDPKYTVGAAGRESDFTPAAPSPFSLSFPTDT